MIDNRKYPTANPTVLELHMAIDLMNLALELWEVRAMSNVENTHGTIKVYADVEAKELDKPVFTYDYLVECGQVERTLIK